MVDIPDQRLTRLADAVKPAKTTPAQVRVEDSPPGSRAQRVAFARQADVLLKVARCFGPEPDPVAELEEFALDLVLADLASVEKRLDVVAKEARAGKKDAQAESEVLAAAKQHLDAGQQLRTLSLEPDQRGMLLGIFPVTLKPAVYVANAAEELLPGGGEPAARVKKLADDEGAPSIALSARLEAELGELDPSEQGEMRASYGIDESGLGRIARAVWEAGGLITYFTAGEAGLPRGTPSVACDVWRRLEVHVGYGRNESGLHPHLVCLRRFRRPGGSAFAAGISAPGCPGATATRPPPRRPRRPSPRPD